MGQVETVIKSWWALVGGQMTPFRACYFSFFTIYLYLKIISNIVVSKEELEQS